MPEESATKPVSPRTKPIPTGARCAEYAKPAGAAAPSDASNPNAYPTVLAYTAFARMPAIAMSESPPAACGSATRP